MKKHSLYRWFRRVAMLSGIPALTMFFTTCCKYGMPNDWIYGVVIDEFGEFRLVTENCIDLKFSKDGYQVKDTMICTPQHVSVTIKLQKQSAE